ncbi:MAG: class II fructose-bisphosphate aldolase [Candidatus Limiplasma sp.]|nr:class II fructose-bisphosphate aldolase [Candidatus Limiplasma sp.]
MLTDVRTLLEIAEDRGCAIPAFNVYNQETALGVLFAAEESNACVILQMYSRLFSNFEARFLAPALVNAARESKVKIAFHLDHGANEEVVTKALRWGCTGVMRDASDLPLRENITATRKVVDFCHPVNVSVEGELGHIGTTKEGVSAEYTRVDEAVTYVQETQVDALAILVGTAHGRYAQAPVIATKRIAEIKEATGIPLVLHGGSGVPDEQITQAIGAGIRKINFGTDLCYAFLDQVMATGREQVAVDLFMKDSIQAVKAFALSKIKLLKAVGCNE